MMPSTMPVIEMQQSDGPEGQVAIAQLGDLLRDRVPAVAAVIAGKHEVAVLSAALDGIIAPAESSAS